MWTRVFIIFALAFFVYNVANAKTIKVAVIDTGFDVKSTWPNASKFDLVKPKLCVNDKEIPNNGIDDDGDGYIDNVHGYNFVANNSDLTDNHGHGTHVSGLIAKYSKGMDYCLVVEKYFDPKSAPGDNLGNTVKAFRYAITQNVDIINYSGGGLEKSKTECELVKKALDKGILIVVAAGNEQSDLTQRGYFPALCDDRVMIATNLDNSRKIATSSNYDEKHKFNTFALEGQDLYSTLPNNGIGKMTGTSQSTAVLTGKMIKVLTTVYKRSVK